MRPVQTEHSPETRRKYAAAFGAWCRFAISQHRPTLPARNDDVATYLLHLAQQGRSQLTVRQAYCGIAAMHRAGGHEPPTVAPGTWLELRSLARRRERRDAARKHAVQLRVTGAELERLRAAARVEGCSLGKLLRERVFAAAEPPPAAA